MSAYQQYHCLPYDKGASFAADVSSDAAKTYTPIFNNKRRVTDVPALITFILGSLLFFLFWIYGCIEGNMSYLKFHLNSRGRLCGQPFSLLESTPFLYYPLDPLLNVYKILPSQSLCLKSCPTEENLQSHHVVPIMKRQISKSSSHQVASITEFLVNTPSYASIPLAGRLCVPTDPALAKQVLAIHDSVWGTYTLMMGSLSSAKKPLMWTILLSWGLLIVGSHGLKRFPRLTFLLFLSVLSLTASILGILLLGLSSNDKIPVALQLYLDSQSMTKILKATAGLCLLVFGWMLPLLMYQHRASVNAGLKVIALTGHLLAQRSPLRSPCLLATVHFFFSWVWLQTILTYSSTVSSPRSWKAYLLSDLNGPGVDVVSTTAAEHQSFFKLILLILLYAIGAWIFEYIQAIEMFASSYIGSVWYFSPGDIWRQDFHTHLQHFPPGCVAAFIGTAYHTGTLALASAFLLLTKPLRYFGHLTRPRYCHWATATFPRHSFERVNDLPVCGGFVYTALHHTSLRQSQGLATERSNRLDSIACRLIGAGEIVVFVVATSISCFTSLLLYMMLTKAKTFGWPMSPNYVVNPGIVLCVHLYLSFLLGSLLLQHFAHIPEAMLHSYLCDAASGRLSCSNYSHRIPHELQKMILDELGKP